MPKNYLLILSGKDASLVTIVDMDGNIVKNVNEMDNEVLDAYKNMCKSSIKCSFLLNPSIIDSEDILDSDSNIRNITDTIIVSRLDDEIYSNIKIVDEKLEFLFFKIIVDEETNIISVDESYKQLFIYNIPNEKIKYIYSYYFQPSGDVYLYILTDHNNLYMSNYSVFDENIRINFDNVTNFKLLYSNVSEMKILPNACPIDAEMCSSKAFYVVFNGDLLKIR